MAIHMHPSGSTGAPVRIGTLGAATITSMALLRPTRSVRGASVVAIAARDPEKARRFAERRHIPRVLESYEALIADPEIDAIYNPLPNSLHCEWTLRALEAGKHVLCEKPFSSNADEARRMAGAARSADRVLMEAFHWRYHPLAHRAKSILERGELGAIQHLEAKLCVPMLAPGNIRYRLDLAGGATMDVGAYTVNMIRYFAGAEPKVKAAVARLSSPRVDRWMQADLEFQDGRTARVTHSLLSSSLLALSVRIRCAGGELRIFNPLAPHIYHHLTIRSGGRSRTERVPRGDATYVHQLRAFVSAIREGKPTLSDPEDAIANMQVIDAIYEKSGLGRRGA